MCSISARRSRFAAALGTRWWRGARYGHPGTAHTALGWEGCMMALFLCQNVFWMHDIACAAVF